MLIDIVGGDHGFNPLDIQNQFERSEKGSRESSLNYDNGKRNVITQTKVTDVNQTKPSKMSSSRSRSRSAKKPMKPEKTFSKTDKN